MRPLRAPRKRHSEAAAETETTGAAAEKAVDKASPRCCVCGPTSTGLSHARHARPFVALIVEDAEWRLRGSPLEPDSRLCQKHYRRYYLASQGDDDLEDDGNSKLGDDPAGTESQEPPMEIKLTEEEERLRTLAARRCAQCHQPTGGQSGACKSKSCAPCARMQTCPANGFDNAYVKQKHKQEARLAQQVAKGREREQKQQAQAEKRDAASKLAAEASLREKTYFPSFEVLSAKLLYWRRRQSGILRPLDQKSQADTDLMNRTGPQALRWTSEIHPTTAIEGLPADYREVVEIDLIQELREVVPNDIQHWALLVQILDQAGLSVPADVTQEWKQKCKMVTVLPPPRAQPPVQPQLPDAVFVPFACAGVKLGEDGDKKKRPEPEPETSDTATDSIEEMRRKRLRALGETITGSPPTVPRIPTTGIELNPREVVRQVWQRKLNFGSPQPAPVTVDGSVPPSPAAPPLATLASVASTFPDLIIPTVAGSDVVPTAMATETPAFDLNEWLQHAGVDNRFGAVLLQEELTTPAVLRTLTDQDLKELGMVTLGARRRFLCHVAATL